MGQMHSLELTLGAALRGKWTKKSIKDDFYCISKLKRIKDAQMELAFKIFSLLVILYFEPMHQNLNQDASFSKNDSLIA